MYEHKFFLIENLTPMHVGSGEANFGIVDNLVQRDVLTDYPTIHASSLKGALKEFFKEGIGVEKTGFIKYIFGEEGKEQTYPGNVRFFESYLLALPLRAQKVPYVMALSKNSLMQLVGMMKNMKKEYRKLIDFVQDLDETKTYANIDTEVEDCNIEANTNMQVLQELLEEEHIAILPEELFKEYLKELPVIARNQLENGVSKNLFYEEVVPRKSRFFTLFSFPTILNGYDEKDIANYTKEFLDTITQTELLPHIGANASIGYGVCRFKEIG